MVNFLGMMGFFMVVITLIFVIIYIKLSPDKKEPMDYTVVRMNFPQVCQYAEGLLLDYKHGKVRKQLTIAPKDVDWMRKSKKKEKFSIEPISFWVNEYQLRFYPRGTLSPDRNILEVYPPIPEGLPTALQDTPMGKSMMEYVAKKKAEKTSVEIVRMEREFEDEMIKELVGKDLFRKYIETDNALGKDLIKKYVDKESKKDSYSSSGS